MSIASPSRALARCQHKPLETTQALYSIFVKPALSNTHAPISTARQSLIKTTIQCRSYKKASGKPAPTPELRRRRNEEIKAWTIQLVDEDTGRLSQPTQLGDVLRTMNKVTHRIEEVKPGNIPICKLIDKKKEVDKMMRQKAEKKLEKKARGNQSITKTFEINWAIDNNDLDHRLARFRSFLEDGYKVEIVLANKKRGRLATTEERKTLLSKLRAVQADVRGSRESKPMEGDASKGVSLLFFQGRLPEQRTSDDGPALGTPAAADPESMQQASAA